MAQDTGLSSRRRGFESRWGYQTRQSRSEHRIRARLPGGMVDAAHSKCAVHRAWGFKSPGGHGGACGNPYSARAADVGSGDRVALSLLLEEAVVVVGDPHAWACGAVGSALPWHGRGRGIEAPQVHHREQETPPREAGRVARHGGDQCAVRCCSPPRDGSPASAWVGRVRSGDVRWRLRSRAVAQFGSAPRSGRGGRRFKSCQPDWNCNS